MGTFGGVGTFGGPGGTEAAAVTIEQLLRSSFRCIGQLGVGFKYGPSELVDGLFVLNSMLDSLSTDDLNAFCTLIQSFTLTPGIAAYTIGPGGTFDGARPTEITKGTLVILTNPTQPLRRDLELLDAEGYQRIALQQTGSTIPKKLFYNPTVTLGTISLWPVPTSADRIEISSGQMLSAGFTAEDDAFVAPPGYLEMVRYQLAIRLAMEWEKPLKEGVLALATEALAKVQRANAPTPQMDCNPGVLPISRSRSGFNIRTGD